MYNINAQMALVHSFVNNFTHSTGNYYNNTVMYFFTGDAPNTLQDIPMEMQTNFVKFSQASVAMSQLNGTPILDKAGTTQFDYSNVENWITVKRHKFVPAMQKWLLSHSVLAQSRTHEGTENWVANVEPGDTQGEGTDGLTRSLVWEMNEMRDTYNLDVLRYSPRQHWYKFDNFNTKFGRYPYRFPLVFTYDQAVTVDSMFISLGSTSNAYVSEHYDFQYWNEVDEVWVDMERLSVAQGTNQKQLIEFSQSYTAKKFKVRMSDTGAYDPYLFFIHLCSSTEPTYGTGPVDITWAALSYTNTANFYDYPSLRYETFETESTLWNREGYPFLFLDVGESGDDCAVTLNKSRGLEAFNEVQILDFNLKFLGSE